MNINFSCQDRTDELCLTARASIKKSLIAVIGVGALGTSALCALARSGCENFMIIDDDVVEGTNIPRQILFDEADINKYKVNVAKEKLLRINGKISVVTHPVLIGKNNVSMLNNASLVLDCTDNIASRKIIDEFCFVNNKPWVHAAVIKSLGEVLAILPGNKRYLDMIKGKDVSEDCAELGVLSTAAIMTGTFQASIALRVLSGQSKGLENKLFRLNTWLGSIDQYTI